MLLEKDFVMQGGVRNYLGETQEVQAPKYWKSSPDSPSTELAYITEAEKGLLLDANLHGSLKNDQANVGASGLLSYDGFGSRDPGQNRAGGDIGGAMDRGGDDSGQQSSGGGSTSAYQGITNTSYNTAMSEAKETRVEAQNVVDLVNSGVNLNDALSGKTSLERLTSFETPFLTLNVLNEIISPFANAANKKRRTSFLEGNDKYGMPLSRDFYIANGRAFNPNATLVEGTPEHDFLKDAGYFDKPDNDNTGDGGNNVNNNVVLFDNQEDFKTIQTNENSMVNDYFNNNPTNTVSKGLLERYEKAKTDITARINTMNDNQYGLNRNSYTPFTQTNTTGNPFFIDYLKDQGLI
tara:strand:- start:121 stop:1173 length:1053 start_codon:yes stop_codon:yes gene_type:complete